MNPVMTMAEVAEYFRHDEPGSRSACDFVRRLVAQGLPCIRGMRPMRFLRRQVEAFAAELAERSAAPEPAPRVKARRKPSSTHSPAAPIADRLAKMRRGAAR